MRRSFVVITVVGMLVLAGCISGTGFDSAGDGEETVPVDGELEIHHIDVGQADATLVITPGGETILIDTGDWRADGRDVIDYLDAQGIDRIDHLVATHAHADHIGGHAAVIEYLEERGGGVGAAYDSGVVHASATYDNYLDAVEAYDVRLFEVADGDELPLEDAAVDARVLNPPEGDAVDKLDDNSVALLVELGGFTYLMTGDAGQRTEQRLVDERGGDLGADAYQAGHHGSSTSSTEPLLETVDPRIAVISSAEDSQYGHPHDEVLEAFADRGVETYWTGVHGDIVLATDGEDVTITTEQEASTDPADLLDEKHERDSASIREPSTIHPSIHPVPPPLSG